MCADIGVPLAKENDAGPDTVMEFLGITIDSVRFETRIPENKISKAKEAIQAIMNREKS